MAYEPDTLRLSKKEILAQFDIAIARLGKNLRGNWKFIGELKGIKALIALTPEANFPYYWLEIMKIFDSIRTLNELRGTPQMKMLADIQETKVAEVISTPTEPKKRLVVDFTKNLGFGGMSDGN